MSDLLVDFTTEELAILNQEYPLIFEKNNVNAVNPKNFDDNTLSEDSPIILDTDNFHDEQQENSTLRHCCEKDCLHSISIEDIHLRRAIVSSFNKRELDIYIFSQILTSIKPNDNIDKKRLRFLYRFNAEKNICREAFLYLNKLTLSKLKRIQNHISHENYVIPLHGNTNKSPIHALPQSSINMVIEFINNYASAHGLPDPGRLARANREILLPTGNNYLSIWHLYSLDNSSISYSSFRKIWKNSIPYIKFQQCKSDLCDICEEFKSKMEYAKEATELESYTRLSSF